MKGLIAFAFVLIAVVATHAAYAFKEPLVTCCPTCTVKCPPPK